MIYQPIVDGLMYIFQHYVLERVESTVAYFYDPITKEDTLTRLQVGIKL